MGLSEEPQTLTEIAHRWFCHLIGDECTDEHDCCDSPYRQPSRAERESVRRAIKRLADDRRTRVDWDTYWKGPELWAFRRSPQQQRQAEEYVQQWEEEMRRKLGG